MNKYKILLFIIFNFIFVNGAQQPFSELEVTIQINKNIDKSVFHKYWKIDNGFYLSYNTPFYFGKILTGCNYSPYKSINVQLPDYQSYYLFIGWLYEFNIKPKLSFSTGISVGNYLMNFNVETENAQFESEIGFEYFCGIKYQISKITKLNLDIGRELIYTYKKLDFILLKAGVSFTLKTPEWLEDIFE